MEELMEEKRYFSKGERLNDVVVIRSLAIVMVVAFHAYDMLFAEAHFPDVNQMYRGMYYTVNNVILQFRMPLYIFISGYLFSHLENDRGKYATFRGLLANKFKRLIIPFYVFATVFMLSINNFSASPYYTWDYLHLWFITMLFLCFIFTRLLSFLPFSRKPWFKLSVLGLFFVLHCLPPLDFYFFAVPNLLRWYFWFYFGYHLYLNRDRLWGVIDGNKAVVLPSLIVLTTVCLWYKCLTVKEWSVAFTWYGELGNIFICVLVWWLVNKLIFKGFIAGGGYVLSTGSTATVTESTSSTIGFSRL